MQIDFTFNLFTFFQSLLGTFLGAGLAFWAQRYKSKLEQNENLKDHLVTAYRQNIANLQILTSYKNNFFRVFNEEFKKLEDLCLNFLEAPATNQIRVQKWHSETIPLLHKSMTSGDDIGSIYKQFWEKLETLRFETSNISFIAKSAPDILSIGAMMHSTVTLMSDELAKRDKYADGMIIFTGDKEALKKPNPDTVKQLFLLFRTRRQLLETLNRAIALSFGLSALLESYYFKRFGRLDFSFVKFTKENLDLLPPITEYNNFFGSDLSSYIVNERLRRAQNIVIGRRERNLSTSIIPPQLN